MVFQLLEGEFISDAVAALLLSIQVLSSTVSWVSDLPL